MTRTKFEQIPNIIKAEALKEVQRQSRKDFMQSLDILTRNSISTSFSWRYSDKGWAYWNEINLKDYNKI